MRSCLGLGFTYCYVTSLPVLAAVVFAARFVNVCAIHASPRAADLASVLAPWNGEWYAQIATDGYYYNAEGGRSVAYFPVYPCLAAATSKITGLPVAASLLVVSHLSLLGSFALLAAYVSARWPEAAPDLAPWTLVAFGLFPTTFYCRAHGGERINARPLFGPLCLVVLVLLNNTPQVSVLRSPASI